MSIEDKAAEKELLFSLRYGEQGGGLQLSGTVNDSIQRLLEKYADWASIADIERDIRAAAKLGAVSERETCIKEATEDWPAAGLGGRWPYGTGDPRGTKLRED